VEETFINPRGEPADIDSLSHRARDLALLIRSEEIAFARLISVSTTDVADVVTFEVDVEVAQDRVHDVRPRERVSVEFSRDDERMPEVLALRSSFPLVPHLNQRETEIPRSLCLSEEPWREVRLSWTPARFVEILRAWFAATARNDLHDRDQSLEPLILGTGLRLILPANLAEIEGPVRLDVAVLKTPEMDRPVFIARHPNDLTDFGAARSLEAVATIVEGAPQAHGIISRTPSTLEDLQNLLKKAAVDVVELLASQLLQWRESKDLLDRKLILIALLPKLRSRGLPVEATDIFAFLTEERVASLGEKLGLWKMTPEGHAALLIVHEPPDPRAINVLCLQPVTELVMRTAALAAGRVVDPRRLVAVGQGALG
jgi:hypothetical protein